MLYLFPFASSPGQYIKRTPPAPFMSNRKPPSQAQRYPTACATKYYTKLRRKSCPAQGSIAKDRFSKKFCVRRGANEGEILATRARRAEVSDCVRNKVLHQIAQKKCPAWDSNPYHRFRRPVLYPVELTGHTCIVPIYTPTRLDYFPA